MEWLASLSSLTLFYLIAVVASLILLVQMGLLLLGVGDDLDVDIDDLNGAGGLSLLSVRSLTGFFGGFGWTGVIALENGFSLLVATGLGAVVGVILMLSVAFFMKALYSLRETGTIDFQNAVGQVGTVYQPIPPNQSGPGQIRVMIQGRLKVIPAYSKGSEKLPGQEKVKVVALLDPGTVLVEPLTPESEKAKEGEREK